MYGKDVHNLSVENDFLVKGDLTSRNDVKYWLELFTFVFLIRKNDLLSLNPSLTLSSDGTILPIATELFVSLNQNYNPHSLKVTDSNLYLWCYSRVCLNFLAIKPG